MVEVLADRALYEFTGGEPPTGPDLEHRYHLQSLGSAAAREVWCNWIIRLAVNQRAVGFVQATVTSNRASLAWLIDVRYQGHNLASEAAQAMARWLVGHGVDKGGLTAHIHPENRASQVVASRIGLHRSSQIDDHGEAIWTSAGSEPPTDTHESHQRHERRQLVDARC